MTKLELKFQKLNRAISALEAIYLKPPSEDRSNIDATIKRFEFTFELFWKCLKEFFFKEGLEINYPRGIIKEAFADNLIDDEDIWLQMLEDRNMSSHTYDEALADEIFSRIRIYTPLIRKCYDNLQSILDSE